MWVAASTTGGATPASMASFHRSTHRHQRSPGRRPGNPHSGLGVDRSFPRARTWQFCLPKSRRRKVESVFLQPSDGSKLQELFYTDPDAGSNPSRFYRAFQFP